MPDPDQPPLSSVDMPDFELTFILVAAAVFAISKYISGKKDDDNSPPPLIDSRYSYNSSTWNQTKQSYRLHPTPSYPNRTPATKAHSQTPTWAPASPDYNYDDYQSSASYTRVPNQTQPSTRSQTRTQTHTSPGVIIDDDGCGFSVAHIRASSQTQLPTHNQDRTWTHGTWPRASSGIIIDDDSRGFSVAHIRASCQTQPPTRSHDRSWPRASSGVIIDEDSHGISAAHVRAPSQRRLSTRTHFSHAYSLPLNTRKVHEPLKCGCSHCATSSCVPSHVYTRSEPPPPTVIQVISSDLLPDGPASVKDLNFAKKLREQARRRGREMSEARSRAKSAQKKGYCGAANAHRQEAIAYESAMKELDKRAAEIIFRENNNKVCSVDVCQGYANGCSQTIFHPRIIERGGWLTFMVCTLPRPFSSQRIKFRLLD